MKKIIFSRIGERFKKIMIEKGQIEKAIEANETMIS